MEPDVAKAFNDLDKRVAYQELLHKEVNPKTNTFVHWDNTATVTCILSIAFAAVTAIVICKFYSKSTKAE